MNVVEIITAIRSAGGSIVADGGSLVVDAPPSLPTEVWDALAANKAVLVDLLAPAVSYADLALQEEREAIQKEDEATDEAIAFPPARPARRCVLVRDTPWLVPGVGNVTFPAGLAGYVIDDLNEITNPIERLTLGWILEADRKAGKNRIAVLLDGRPRVLEAAYVQILDTPGDRQS